MGKSLSFEEKLLVGAITIPKKPKGRSLNPPKAVIWMNCLKHKHWIYNKDQRLDGKPQISLNEFAKMLGYHLEGMSRPDYKILPAIDVNKLP